MKTINVLDTQEVKELNRQIKVVQLLTQLSLIPLIVSAGAFIGYLWIGPEASGEIFDIELGIVFVFALFCAIYMVLNMMGENLIKLRYDARLKQSKIKKS